MSRPPLGRLGGTHRPLPIGRNGIEPAERPEHPPSQPRKLGLPRPPAAITLVALFGVVLIRLPLLVGSHNRTTRIAVVGLLLVAAMSLAPYVRRGHFRISALAALAAYLLVVLITVLRTPTLPAYGLGSTWSDGFTNWLMIAALAFFGVMYTASAGDAASLMRRFRSLAYAPAVYVAVNVALREGRPILPFALPQSASGASGTKAELLTAMGFPSKRIAFPLAVSVNNFGIIAAAGLTAVIVLALRTTVTRRWITWCAGLLCLYGVLATDSRGPLAYAVAVIVVTLVQRRMSAARGLAVIFPVSSLLALVTLGFIASTGVANSLSRGSGDIGSGNGRSAIWSAAFHLLRHPTFHHLYGYGAYGEITSGIVYQYSFVFGGTAEALLKGTTHNLALQTIVDSGYLGLAALLWVIVAATISLGAVVRRYPNSPAAAVFALFIVCILCGTTEALPSYILLDTLALFALILGGSVGAAGYDLADELDTAR